LRIGDDMVGRQHQQQRVAACRHRLQRRGGDRRRGVASDRLQQDRGFDTSSTRSCSAARKRWLSLATTIGGNEASGAIRFPGCLQHGVVADERQELLGIHLARQWPQSGAGTARQQYRLDLLRLKMVIPTSPDWFSQFTLCALAAAPPWRLHERVPHCA
jgi:hypothetical protein